MPSVTTPGLRTAPAGVTSFVRSLRVIAVLEGSTFSIRPSTAFSDSRVGVVAPRGGELRPAGGGSCGWANAAATKIAGASIATNSANVFVCQPSCDAGSLVVRLSPDHDLNAVGVLLDVDRRVRERLGYFLVDEQHRASVVLDDLVIVLQCVGKDLKARIRAADTEHHAGTLDQILEFVLEGFPCPLGHLHHVSRSFHVSAWYVIDGAGSNDPGRAHRRRRRASKARSRTLYERAVESGLKTPRPRRRKLGRRDEAYLGPRPWCSATRPGPLAS